LKACEPERPELCLVLSHVLGHVRKQSAMRHSHGCTNDGTHVVEGVGVEVRVGLPFFCVLRKAAAMRQAASHSREIGGLLPKNMRQHCTLQIQKDVLPYALC